MAALDTVQDYVSAARVLLQDQVAEYRYPDPDLLAALNFAMTEARKIRPDLFLGRTVPYFVDVDSTPVNFDTQYRVAVVFYMVGFAQLRDDENTQDQRASAFMQKFTAGLATLG